MNIRRQLYLATTLIVLVMTGLLLFSIYGVRQGYHALLHVQEHHVATASALKKMDAEIKEIRFRLAGYLIGQLPPEGNRNQLQEARKRIRGAWRMFKDKAFQNHFIGNEQELTARIDNNLRTVGPFFDALERAYDANDKALATRLLEDEWPVIIHMGLLKPIGKLIAAQEKAVEEIYYNKLNSGEQLLTLVKVSFFIIIVLLIGFTVRLVATITRPLAAAVDTASRIAAGDMEHSIGPSSTNEIGQLLEAIEAMRQQVSARSAELIAKGKELERSNRELDQFAYVTSHDLKAPLRAIANLSEWIEEDIGERLTDDTRKQMVMLRGRVHRMEELISGILQYSRVGRVAVDIETVDVGDLLAETIDTLTPPAGLRIEVKDNMPVFEAARVRLSQVFANLISNAIKYHDRPDGRIEVSVQDAGDFYQFSVADDGPGIAPKFHDKVFQIFQTLQARDEVESTGVGLTLVKKIVEEQEGTISLESEEGEGATFRFTWPKQPAKEAGQSCETAVAQCAKSEQSRTTDVATPRNKGASMKGACA